MIRIPFDSMDNHDRYTTLLTSALRAKDNRVEKAKGTVSAEAWGAIKTLRLMIDREWATPEVKQHLRAELDEFIDDLMNR